MSTTYSVKTTVTVPVGETYCQCTECKKVFEVKGLLAPCTYCDNPEFRSLQEGYLAEPEGLSPKGKKAYNAVIKFLAGKWGDTGGCKAFYSPQEWANRGEDYGTESELIIVYDGGDLGYIFNMDHGMYTIYESMMEKFYPHGLFCEACTNWYSAVYEG